MAAWQLRLKRLVFDDEGQDLVEYAFLIVFLALLIVGTLKATNTSIAGVFLYIIDQLPA